MKEINTWERKKERGSNTRERKKKKEAERNERKTHFHLETNYATECSHFMRIQKGNILMRIYDLVQ
jgi:hypothetical protein